MKELVIVPTYNRSDMLYCCLEAIRAAEPQIAIHVFPDRGTDESNICSEFGAIHHLTVQHSYHGNTYNVMEALRWAYSQNADRVFIIEDDAIIDPTFFEWSRQALTDWPDMFAACGWQYSPNAIVSEGPDLRMPWYLSVCACLPRKSLSWIVPHARPEYYSKMREYLYRAFPMIMPTSPNHFEQDGLVWAVMNSLSKRCIWPRRPRATHVGFTGYHMGERALEGTLEERVNIIKLAIKNPSLLKTLMSGGKVPELAACERCSKPLLSENKTARIVCVDCFHLANAGPVTSGSHYYLKPA